VRPGPAVLGVGGRPGADGAELDDLVDGLLAEHGLTGEDVTAVATLGRRAGEPALVALVRRLEAELAAYPPEVLAAQDVPHPSDRVLRHTGLAGVAEASVLASGADLVSDRRSSPSWTVALGRRPDTAQETP
jgi:cobalt-precorrin 5A hydrolase/precorrin-3B C17-methyltransferase